MEAGNSYFPGESYGAGPSYSAHGNSYNSGDNQAGPSSGSTAQKRKVSGNDYTRNESKAQGSNGGPDYARRKVSEANYTGNNGLVADHCMSPSLLLVYTADG